MTALLKELDEALGRRPEEIKQARQAGRKVVGWINYNIPEEILHALDLIPVRLGKGGDSRLVEVGGRYISTKNCVFVREIVGLFEEKKDLYITNLDLLAVDATCLQIFRAAEVLKYYFNIKILILGVPKNFYQPEGEIYFVKEVEDFTRKLEDFAGKKITAEKLAASINLYKEIRKHILALYEYLKNDKRASSALAWRNIFKIVQAGNVLDRTYYLSFLQRFLAELELKSGERKEEAQKVRIFLSGSIMPPGDTKLIDIIEQNGGEIVADDLWSGLSPFIDLNIKEPTVAGVAQAYIHRLPHGSLPYLDLATDRRVKNLVNLVKEYNALGVIFHTLRYCDPYTFKAAETKNILNENGFPFLEIHTEYAASDFEAIRTRIEAFIEMIKNRELGSSAYQSKEEKNGAFITVS